MRKQKSYILLFIVTALFTLLFVGCQLSDKSSRSNDTVLADSVKNAPQLTNEQLFFKSIYKKYPKTYFELGSLVTFYERRDSITHKYTWTVSFMVVDPNEKDEKQYLKEINDPVLKKYLPSTHFYYGKHSTHYELSVNGLDFIGFLNAGKGDFISDTTACGLKPDFVNAVKGITIKDNSDKQKFCSSLLTLLAPVLLFKEDEYKKVSSGFEWKNNTLTVTDNYKYKAGNGNTSTVLSVSFDNDQLTEIKVKSAN